MRVPAYVRRQMLYGYDWQPFPEYRETCCVCMGRGRKIDFRLLFVLWAKPNGWPDGDGERFDWATDLLHMYIYVLCRYGVCTTNVFVCPHLLTSDAQSYPHKWKRKREMEHAVSVNYTFSVGKCHFHFGSIFYFWIGRSKDHLWPDNGQKITKFLSLFVQIPANRHLKCHAHTYMCACVWVLVFLFIRFLNFPLGFERRLKLPRPLKNRTALNMMRLCK